MATVSLVAEQEKRRKSLTLYLIKYLHLGILEFFTEGSITINQRICKGVECRLCIEACATNALQRRDGEIKATEELCIYCGACVLNCPVNGCIKIVRKRSTGEVESFNKSSEFLTLQHNINSTKRFKRIQCAIPWIFRRLSRTFPLSLEG
jgi:Fe-S-cluster-containing hydrogenase component 2